MTSCYEEPGLEILYDGEFLEVEAGTTVTGDKQYAYPRFNDGVGLPSGFNVILAAAHKSTAVNYTFEIDPSSTAIENLHYTLDATSGTIDANTSTDEIPITIIDDNINLGEIWTIVVNLTGGDVPINPNYVSGTHLIQVTCNPAFVGDIVSYNYAHTNNFAGADLTGTGQIERFNMSDTEYTFTDFSFGSWGEAHSIDPPVGTLRFIENCGRVEIEGTDNYGDSWQLNDVTASGGPEFTFTWENTYGEFGTVTLTMTDGSDWPVLVP